MKPTNFAYYLTNFLSKYLPGIIGASPNTVMSYRDSFSLLLNFYILCNCIKPDKLSLEHIDKNQIELFLKWLGEVKGSTTSTRNVRLAAIHSFCRYLQMEFPDYIDTAQQILSIPMKKTIKKTIEYVRLDAMKLLLDSPDQNLKMGRRDTALLSLLYDSGARVQEIVDLKARDLRIQTPSTLKLTGKGNKQRVIPLMAPMTELMIQYLKEFELTGAAASDYYLFNNRMGNRLTRAGVTYILDKYVKIAKEGHPHHFPEKISPHSFRHSKAIHLLQSGVNLIYIRDFLGHVDIKTTEVYARINAEMKRKALESNTPNLLPDNRSPKWQSNVTLMAWLKSLDK
jgi:integrase/recombinase XerD